MDLTLTSTARFFNFTFFTIFNFTFFTIFNFIQILPVSPSVKNCVNIILFKNYSIIFNIGDIRSTLIVFFYDGFPKSSPSSQGQNPINYYSDHPRKTLIPFNFEERGLYLWTCQRCKLWPTKRL